MYVQNTLYNCTFSYCIFLVFFPKSSVPSVDLLYRVDFLCNRHSIHWRCVRWCYLDCRLYIRVCVSYGHFQNTVHSRLPKPILFKTFHIFSFRSLSRSLCLSFALSLFLFRSLSLCLSFAHSLSLFRSLFFLFSFFALMTSSLMPRTGRRYIFSILKGKSSGWLEKCRSLSLSLSLWVHFTLANFLLEMILTHFGYNLQQRKRVKKEQNDLSAKLLLNIISQFCIRTVRSFPKF